MPISAVVLFVISAFVVGIYIGYLLPHKKKYIVTLHGKIKDEKTWKAMQSKKFTGVSIGSTVFGEYIVPDNANEVGRYLGEEEDN